MLKTTQDFLADPDGFRKKANDTFVVDELSRSQALFDRVEKRPLTEEQRLLYDAITRARRQAFLLISVDRRLLLPQN